MTGKALSTDDLTIKSLHDDGYAAIFIGNGLRKRENLIELVKDLI